MKKTIVLLLALVMLLGLAACSNQQAPADASAAPETSAAPDDSSAEEAPLVGTDVNIAVLAGPTGIGASALMEANDAGETVNKYTFSVESAPDQVTAGVVNGSLDMAAVPTNLASVLYTKTNGGVQVVALNTYGVLYILENGDSVKSVADLKGKTLYATGQGSNPEYVLEYLLTENGLSYSIDGSDADVKIQFMTSEELTAGMVSGQLNLCMLPVPAVTAVTVQNPDVRVALDLTKEWDNLGVDGKLTQGCIIVRTEFAKENPDAVKAFLQEYQASIDAVLADPAHAGELCEQYGIVPKAPIATKAIPNCNLCCVTGDEIRTVIEPFFKVMLDANPQSIGGALPGDDFYFVAK